MRTAIACCTSARPTKRSGAAAGKPVRNPESWTEAFHPDDQGIGLRGYKNGLAAGTSNTSTGSCAGRLDAGWRREGSRPRRAGKLVRITGVAEDITERKQLEEQLRNAQQMEAVGQLAGGIAHDFNNLLTVISGYAELGSLGSTLRGPLRRDLEQIKQDGQPRGALTRQLLAFSRKQVLQPKVLT